MDDKFLESASRTAEVRHVYRDSEDAIAFEELAVAGGELLEGERN